MHAWWERLVAVFLPPQVEPFITALWRVNKTMIKTVMLWLAVCFSAAAGGKGDEKFIRWGPPVLCAQGLFACCAGHLRHAVSGSRSLLLEQEARGDRGHGPSKGCVQHSLQGEGKASQTAQPLSGCQVSKAGALHLGWASRSVVWLG